MAYLQQLARLEIARQLAIEIQGPPPPDRVVDNIPTLARFVANSPLDGSITVTGSVCQESVNRFDAKPFLFEETAYYLTVELLSDGLSPEGLALVAPGRFLPVELRRVGRSRAFTACLNFGSEVGHVDLQVRSDRRILLNLGLEVFPSKIDYRKDMASLRRDLEIEVRDLAFSVAKTTYQRAKRRRDTKAAESEWLENLRQLFDELQKAFVRVKRTPLSKILTDPHVRRADRPTRHSPDVRRHIRSRMNRCREVVEQGHFQALDKWWSVPDLPMERKVLSYDTTENRYVKWALRMLLLRVRNSLAKVRRPTPSDKGRFNEWEELLQRVESRLRSALDSTFLTEIDDRRLAPVQSLALHMAPGYREFFTTCLDLVGALRISGGPFQLSEKEMHLLYEMWCFIKLGSILRRKCGGDKKPAWLRVDRTGITVTLKKGVRSELRLKSVQGENLLVSYNPTESSPTGSCIPDTMLSVDKAGSRRGFHYVFDAKYRIADDKDYVNRHNAPGPPEDTINKMHAYRDRITYSPKSGGPVNGGGVDTTVWDLGVRRYSQKVVSAFVLYPNALPTAPQNTYFESVRDFGVGGLPFLPGRTEYVEQLLSHVIEASSESEEDSAIVISTEDERVRIEKSHSYGMLVIVSSKEQMEYVKQNQIYHMPYKELRGIRLRADFLLFLQTKTQFPGDAGVNYMARVKNFQVGDRSDISPPPPWAQTRADPYAWFRLHSVEQLRPPLPADNGGRQMYFRLTTRLALDEARTIDELSLVREPERRLYTELKRAGFDVTVRERRDNRSPTYDISDLRLYFRVRWKDRGETVVSFDPATAVFQCGSHEVFDFNELMFAAEGCMTKVAKTLTPLEDLH